MSAVPQPPERDFNQVRRDLEELMLRLRNAPYEKKVRLKIMKQLRLLLDEADCIVASENR